MEASTVVAQIMIGKEIFEHEIMATQIRQDAQRSKGVLPYPIIITFLCVEEGSTYIQGIYKCI